MATALANPPTLLVTRVNFTADVTISTSTEGTATTIVTAASFTPNGTDLYRISFYAPQTVCANADFIIFCLYDNGSFLDRMGTNAQTTNNNNYCYIERYLTPSNAAHVYSIRGFRGSVNGTVKAGAGGTGVLTPGYVAITKAI